MSTGRLGAPSRWMLSMYAIATFAIGMLLASQLFAFEEAAFLFKAVFFGLLALTFWRWSGAIVLLGIQAYLFFCEPAELSEVELARLMSECILAVVLVMLISRLRSLMQLHQINGIHGLVGALMPRTPEIAAEVPTVGDQPTGLEVNASAIPPVQPVSHLAALGLMGLSASAAVVLAWGLYSSIPIEPQSIRKVGLIPSALRTLHLSAVLAFIYILISLLLNEWSWRNKTRRQAVLYLRTTLSSWLYADFRAQHRRRKRAKSS